MEVEQKQDKQPQSPADNEKIAAASGGSDLQEDQGQTIGCPEAPWDEAFLVTFSAGDPENPLNWSKKVKWGITSAVSGTGFVRIMVSTVRHLCA